MTRNLIVIAILSFIVAFWTTQAAYVLGLVQGMHDYIDKVLSIEISGFSFGQNMREAIALILVPLIAAIIIRLVFMLLKKPSIFIVDVVVWVVWIILATVLMANA